MWGQLLAALSIATLFQVGATQNSPQDLTSHLLKGYPEAFKYARPVNNASETLKVKFGIGLVRLKNFDEETGVATFGTWLRYLWTDRRMKWDPSKFGGQTTAYLPTSKIWVPDLWLYNSYDSKLFYPDVLAVAYNSGDVLWIPPVDIRVVCESDGKDEYTCIFRFGSWVYDGYKLDLEFYEGMKEVDVSDYVVSNKFSVISNTAKRNEKYYPCCVEPYPDLTFKLVLKRHRPY